MILTEKRISGILIALLALLTAYSMVVRFQLYSLEVTLWYDEGLLVTNIISQSFGELVSTPLNVGWGAQSAPLFFVAVVKLFTMAFGVSEASVRAFSFVLCIGLLIGVYFLCRKAFRLSPVFSWLAVCLTATLPLYVRYSNEMKPYMGDACFAVLILLLYYLYRSGKLNLFVCAALYAVMIFFSTPSIFFIAAVLAIEFIRNLKNKERRAALFTVIAGLIAIAAFLLHYFYWLRSTASDPFMFSFWIDHRFHLPISSAAIEIDLYLLEEFFLPFGGLKYLFIFFGLAGFFISIVHRNIYSIITGLAFILLLAVSSFSMYPVISRLWLFTFAFCILYAVYFISHLRVKLRDPRHEKLASIVIMAGFSLALLAGNASFTTYAKGATDKDYPGMNVNPLIAYVEENIREGEKLYSFETATPILWFKNGYGNERIGDVSEDNIILGSFNTKKDVDVIAGIDDVYVLYNRGYIPFSLDYRVIGLSEDLSQRGYMDRVLDINYTPLFWFTTDFTHLKTSAVIEGAGENDEGEALIRVINTGSTILETRESALERGAAGPVKLMAKLFRGGSQYDEMELAVLPAPLLPGETVDVAIRASVAELLGGADRVVIDLVSEGRFSFSDLGAGTIELSLKGPGQGQ